MRGERGNRFGKNAVGKFTCGKDYGDLLHCCMLKMPANEVRFNGRPEAGPDQIIHGEIFVLTRVFKVLAQGYAQENCSPFVRLL